MAAYIGEGTDLQVAAAHDDDAFAQIVERVPVARRGNVAFVADDLPTRPKDALALDAEELGIMVAPGRQAPVGIGIGRGGRVREAVRR